MKQPDEMVIALKILGVLFLLMVAMLTVPLAQAWEIIDWQWWMLMSPCWVGMIAVCWFARNQR